MSRSKPTIALAGGGTGGPTTPLLAVAAALKRLHPEAHTVFIGTGSKLERMWLEELGLEGRSLPVAKLRRYISFWNLVDLFVLPFSIFKASAIILRDKVDVVVGAGSYISVPVVWAAKILGRKVLIHQQDILPTLSNLLTKNFANTVTLTFEEQKKGFPTGVVAGNPVRSVILEGSSERGRARYGFSVDKPLLLIFGGSQGAAALNSLTETSASMLLDQGFQILHITGQNAEPNGDFLAHIAKGYVRREALNGQEMADALAAADLVLSRAGLGTISELSNLGKPAIIIPIPDSHQELNAKLLADKNAALVLNQNELNAEKLFESVNELFKNKTHLAEIQKNISKIMPHDAADTIAKLVYKLL